MTKLLLRLFIKDPQDTKSAAARERYGVLSSGVGIFCNLLLFFGKLVMGRLANSIAVTADAFNNLSDVGSSVVTLVGFKMASKPADRDHPFGHGRIEYLSGLVVAFLILMVGLEVGKTSVEKILHPEPVEFSLAVAAGLVASILVKLWMGLFNRSLGRMIGSTAMEATAVDSISDVCATAVTLVSVVASLFTDWPVDGLMGVVVAGMILFAGYGVVKDTLAPLLGERPDPQLVDEISRLITSYPGVLGIHDLVVHDYGPSRRMASVHAEVPMDQDILISHDTIDRAEREVARQLNIELVIHLDPVETNCERTKALKETTEQLVRGIDPSLHIHDFRAVFGGELTNFIFDVVVPFGEKRSDEDIRQEIQRRFRALDPNYTAVVTVDRDYCG